MNRSIKIFCLFIILLCFAFSTFSFGQEKEGFIKRLWRRISGKPKVIVEEEEKVVPVEKPVPEVTTEATPELTKAEMIEAINEDLDLYGDEISLAIPSIVQKTDEAGKTFYLFSKETGEEIAFGELDEETLISLYRAVGTQAGLIRQQRIELQMEQLRNLEAIQRQQQITQPPSVPEVPQPYTPPAQPPKVYTPPEIPVEIPAPPPSPPQLPERR